MPKTSIGITLRSEVDWEPSHHQRMAKDTSTGTVARRSDRPLFELLLNFRLLRTGCTFQINSALAVHL
jgi:hypothetical protein